MRYYFVPGGQGFPPELAATQDDARELCRQRKLRPSSFGLYVVPDGKAEQMAFVNQLLASAEPPEAPPLTRDEIVNSNTLEAQQAARELMKPALTQAEVDAWFEPGSKRPKPTVDEVCACISSYDGAAIGHVAHELAARIQRLGKEVA